MSPAAAKAGVEKCRYKAETVRSSVQKRDSNRVLRSTEIHSPRPSRTTLKMYIIPIILLLVSVTTTAPTTDLSVLHRLQKRAPACYAADLALRRLLEPRDCIAATNQMPIMQIPGPSAGAAASSELVGQFSNAAPDGSSFKLPRWFRANTCTIGVTMVSPLPHNFESASWTQIYRNAVDIIGECVTRRTPLGKGGTCKAGQSDGILIEVYGSFLPHQQPVGLLGSTGQGSASRVQ